MIHKKLCSILCIVLKPVARFAEAKTITPGIHIEHQPVAANTVNVIGQDDLQVTNGGFLKIIATGISVETRTSVLGHANDMAGFVQ
jgi:hypothetical protein